MFGPESASWGVTGSYRSGCYIGMGAYFFFIFSLGTENFEAEAVRLFWFSVTPGKLCLTPKVLLGGLRDRTVEYTTWVWGFKFAKSFYSNREFRSQSGSAVIIFRNPRKRMFGPLSASWEVTGSYCWAYYMGIGIPVVYWFFYFNRAFRILSCSAVLIFRNPQKAMFGSESASWGLRDRTVEYTTFGYGEILNFQNLFIAIENFEA